jgi:hypothetical protein
MPRHDLTAWRRRAPFADRLVDTLAAAAVVGTLLALFVLP